MRNLNVLTTIIVLIAGFIGMCGCQRAQEVLLTESMSTPMQISVVYPGDCLGDSSFCDVLYHGVKKAQTELGVEIAEIESNAEAWETDLREAAQRSQLVLTSGFQMSEPLAKVAPEFPDVKFVIFVGAVDLPNVASYTHKANEGAFLVGAIAGLTSKTGKVGYLGGADVPGLHQYEVGYVAGVKAVNPEAEVLIDYVADDAQGFYQPDAAKTIALGHYENSVDVIYSMADAAGFGAVEAAQEGEDRYVIWTFMDVNATAPEVILTSLLVGIDTDAYRVISDFAEGNFTPGIHSPGLAEGGVDYAPDEQLSAEIVEQVEALKAQIISGEIVVPMERP